jgi:hypothetical protein
VRKSEGRPEMLAILTKRSTLSPFVSEVSFLLDYEQTPD